MYDQNGRLINLHDIELQTDPKHSGNQKLGMKMTTVRHGLIGEDSIVFKQTMAYSIKTNEQSVLLRCKADLAKKWPNEIHNHLKMHSLDKYSVLFNQIQSV